MNRGEGLTTRALEARLGVSRRLIGSLVSAGLVTPARGPRGEHVFSFQDVVLIRTAASLHQARVAPAQILRALRRLERLAPDRHLSGVRMSASSGKVSVRDRHGAWLVESGQRLMEFEPAPDDVRVVELARAAASETAADDAFARAQAIEPVDAVAAEAGYRRALSLSPGMLDAYLNLGCLLSDQQRFDDVIALYEGALGWLPEAPQLHYNLGVALEDIGAPQSALAAYDRCIALAPGDADAHYNAARLHHELGHFQKAVRHFNQYRKLNRAD
ncbi:tetratricopeptide repeat protein [Cupriavidus oxalaticus]|uniref:tetratricopeptide repeat protein n=1 Tax=Cupriavidus oxalaticus TaxID=96344 RepID=UPI0031736C59